MPCTRNTARPSGIGYRKSPDYGVGHFPWMNRKNSNFISSAARPALLTSYRPPENFMQRTGRSHRCMIQGWNELGKPGKISYNSRFQSLQIESAFKSIDKEGITDLKTMVKENALRALLDAGWNAKIIKSSRIRSGDKAIRKRSSEPGRSWSDQRWTTELMGGRKWVQYLRNIILVAGLQGSGKTTFCGKWPTIWKPKREVPVGLVAADIYRPAAIDQLRYWVVDRRGGFQKEKQEMRFPLHKTPFKEARSKNKNVIIIDTAGRPAVDEAMMTEVAKSNPSVPATGNPFVVDRHDQARMRSIPPHLTKDWIFPGVVLTKLDLVIPGAVPPCSILAVYR